MSLKGDASELWRRASADGVSDYAASLSYRMLLALFPFAIFVAAAGGIVANLLHVPDPTAQIIAQWGRALPGEARSLIEPQLRSVIQAHSSSLLSIGLLGAIWAAAGGTLAAIRAMNHAFEVREDRPWWKLLILALLLTTSSAILFVAAFLLMLGSEALAATIANRIGIDTGYRTPLRIIEVLAAAIVLFLAVAILYCVAPAGRRPFRWVTPGSAVFVIGWLVASFGLSVYVSHFASYQATYGTLGGVIVLMLWLYVTAYLLFLGAEIDGMIMRREQPEATEAIEPVDEPGEPEPAAASPKAAGHSSPRRDRKERRIVHRPHP